MADAMDEGLPRAVALAWGMAADPQRGPKRELSHERIIEAAIAIADAEGLGAVTMSKVATSLGFTTMSLYRYVTSKDDLLRLMQDAVCAVPLPAEVEEDWRTALRTCARIVHGIYLDHPWFIEIPISQSQLMTPNNLMIADQLLRAMRGLRLGDQEKIGLLLLVSGYVRAFGSMAHDLDRESAAGEQPQAAQWALLAELLTPTQFPDLYPLVRSGAYLGADEPPAGQEELQDDFAFGLERILDGVAAYVEGRAPVTPVPEEDVTPLAEESVRRDKAVREASRARREAEAKLREARGKLREAVKRENELITKALERARSS